MENLVEIIIQFLAIAVGIIVALAIAVYVLQLLFKAVVFLIKAMIDISKKALIGGVIFTSLYVALSLYNNSSSMGVFQNVKQVILEIPLTLYYTTVGSAIMIGCLYVLSLLVGSGTMDGSQQSVSSDYQEANEHSTKNEVWNRQRETDEEQERERERERERIKREEEKAKEAERKKKEEEDYWYYKKKEEERIEAIEKRRKEEEQQRKEHDEYNRKVHEEWERQRQEAEEYNRKVQEEWERQRQEGEEYNRRYYGGE